MQVENFKHIVPGSMLKGDIIPLRADRPGHWDAMQPNAVSENPAANFSDMLIKALQKVNDQDIESQKLTQQMAIDPDSVEAHTVMIAAEKARMSITYAKTLVDLGIRTYRELINLR